MKIKLLLLIAIIGCSLTLPALQAACGTCGPCENSCYLERSKCKEKTMCKRKHRLHEKKWKHKKHNPKCLRGGKLINDPLSSK